MSPFASRDLMVKALDATKWQDCKPGEACSNDGTQVQPSVGCDKIAGDEELAGLQTQLAEHLASV